MKLIDAPAGLFEFDGVLALKTSYCTIHPRKSSALLAPDCYILDSGEYFWGGAKTIEERNDLEVTPVAGNTVYVVSDQPLTLEEMKQMGGKPYWHVGLRKESSPPHWVILDPIYAKHIEDYYYGKRWIGYRCPPKEETVQHKV